MSKTQAPFLSFATLSTLRSEVPREEWPLLLPEKEQEKQDLDFDYPKTSEFDNLNDPLLRCEISVLKKRHQRQRKCRNKEKPQRKKEEH
jgi:hypothetical protein